MAVKSGGPAPEPELPVVVLVEFDRALLVRRVGLVGVERELARPPAAFPLLALGVLAGAAGRVPLLLDCVVHRRLHATVGHPLASLILPASSRSGGSMT